MMMADIHANSDYRANLVKVMAKRAVAQLADIRKRPATHNIEIRGHSSDRGFFLSQKRIFRIAEIQN